MSKPVTANRMLALINALDWSGHVEIGDNDKVWLAMSLADLISPPHDKARCEACGVLQTIVIKTALGSVCEDCLDDFSTEAATLREDMEAANES
jgi:hypothetical protein